VNLHILVTCTKRKSRAAAPKFLMQNVAGSTIDRRLANWTERLSKAHGPGIEARELYAGDHWRISCGLPGMAENRGFASTLWVISAGYGLIQASDRVQPYSAAFSPGHIDCVVPASHPGGIVDGFHRWWKAMGKWRGPVPGQPRTIDQLVRRDRSGTFLVIASDLYLRSVWDDLVKAKKSLAKSGRMIIVSAGTKEFGPLAECAVPVDARMQEVLGGARRTLNVRMARFLLSWMTPDQSMAKIQRRCAQAMEGRELFVWEPRERCTDAEVISFIRRETSHEQRVSATLLLNKLRQEAQRACEQKRFSRLFRQAREAIIA
jgi:hypothetical protein